MFQYSFIKVYVNSFPIDNDSFVICVYPLLIGVKYSFNQLFIIPKDINH